MVYTQQLISGSGVPSLSPKYPWFVAQKNLEPEEEEDEVHTLYNLHDPMSFYRYQIPELVGKCIRGCFHGCWVLLSSNRPRDVIWSLWNPFTSHIINLPPLIHSEGHDIRYCCLSAPPDHPNSVLYLTITKKPNILFICIGSSHRRLRWRELKYVFSRKDSKFNSFHFLTCCNSKVYALFRAVVMGLEDYMLVEIYTEVNNIKEVQASVLRVCEVPCPDIVDSFHVTILKGSCTELFFIVLGLMEDTSITATSLVTDVFVYKLDMNNKKWVEMKDLKDTILSVEIEIAESDSELLCVGDPKASTFYSPAINASSAELGGYVHILANKGKIVYSYLVKDKTVSLSYIPCLSGTNHHVSAWAMFTSRLESDSVYVDCKLEKEAGDKEDGRLSVKGNHDLNFPFRASKLKEFCVDRSENENAYDSKQEGESHLLNLPFHVLEMLMEEFCIGVEYLKIRSTCKRCHLATPLIPSWHKNDRNKLQKYHSPWLIVFDQHKGIITFTDSLFGDKYFIKTPQKLICDLEIKCCRNGWLLIKKSGSGSLVFYNPFTSDIRELPQLHNADILSFSAQPTSPDCIVVGNSIGSGDYSVCILHFVGGGVKPSSWCKIQLDISYGPDSFSLLTFYGRDLYSLRGDRGVDVVEEIGVREDHSWKRNVAKAPPTSSFPQQSFLLRCDEHDLLHVMVGKFGESVEVYKLNNNDSDSSSTQEEWVKVNSLGKHMIFLCGTSSLCIDAKTPHMENKIYFPKLPSDQDDNRNHNDIVFCSLETCRYHTFNQESFGDFSGTKHFLEPHAWIEPTWS